MLSSLTIQNYRAFRELRLKDLGRVNVFVGRNNSGKSSLLEAFYLYGEKFDADVFRRIASKRGEMVAEIGGDEFLPELSHFFAGHEFKAASAFVVSGDDGTYKVDVDARLEVSRHEDYVFSRAREMSHDAVVGLRVLKKGKTNSWKTLKSYPITTGGVLFSRMSPRFSLGGRDTTMRDIRFISPELLDFQLLAKMWNRIITSGKEGEIIEALRILSRDIGSIQFLLTELSNYRYAPKSSAGIVVGIQGTSLRVPLGSLGDGMRRLLALAMALLCVEKGCLYIDEIDVGFHYSVMKDIWQLVLTLARRKNIQVFVSTHSLDCLKGLADVCNCDKQVIDGVSLYALHAPDAPATRYSGSEIVKAIQNAIEVRS